MKYSIDFQLVGLVSKCKEESLLYFQEHGFVLSKETNNSLQFERGSLWKNMVTFNPLEWKSLILIHITNNRVQADFVIDSTFQLVTAPEVQVWENFVTNYQQTLTTSLSLIAENQEQLTATQQSYQQYILPSIGGGLSFGILGVLVWHVTGYVSSLLVAPLTGMLFFIYLKIGQEEKQQKEPSYY